MNKTTALAAIIVLAFAPPAHAWISYLDFNDGLLPTDPWQSDFSFEGGPGAEGGADFVDLGGGNMALRMNSPDHTVDDPDPPPGTYYNEYYVVNIPPDPTALEFYEPVAAARFRLHSFTHTGTENILSPSTPIAAPSISLVDGRYKIWSFLSDQSDPIAREILDLGPAIADQWHEVYIMPTVEGVDESTGAPNAGGAKVWWDGAVVFDGPVDGGANVSFGGYIEFGSGTYWQVDAGTTVDFDWVGFGDVNDFPVPPLNPADFDEDGDVDSADLAEWQTGFGTAGTAVHMDGDADGDQDVDGADFLVWQRQLGVSVAAAVPEPPPVMLLAMTAPLLIDRRCRCHLRRSRD